MLTRTFRHSFMAISTDFELEPVLEQYFRTYPDSDRVNYQIVYKTENEHFEGTKSYLVVFELSENVIKPRISLHEFIDSYCKLNNLMAVCDPRDSIFPKMSLRSKGGTYLGNTDKYKDR
jgi:hypothetical protein